MITERINQNLSALFDKNNDRVYKVLISDSDGTIPATIAKPTDIDIGAIASQIEYLRRLSINTAEQMYLDQASSSFLKFILNNYFDSLRISNESDADWISRVIATIFSHKVSRATIIYAMRPFSSQEPEITNVITQSAFADFSYADVYVSDEVDFEGETVYVLSAVAENYESAFFTLKVILYDTDLSDIYTIQDILDSIIASGISVIIQINYTI
jgi:hypothetical protein